MKNINSVKRMPLFTNLPKVLSIRCVLNYSNISVLQFGMQFVYNKGNILVIISKDETNYAVKNMKRKVLKSSVKMAKTINVFDKKKPEELQLIST